MNCATHNDVAAVAFCRTCGKPLCNQCTRDVRGVIYCEACLAARMEGTAPAAGFVAPAQTVYPPAGSASSTSGPRPPLNTGPNPAVAGILAGFFPIGVGAVYTGQYAKGLSHLVIMVLLILGVSSNLPWYVITVLGILIGFFYIYQIIDAVRSAKAIQMGEPAPDPFGLAATFGSGEKFEGTKVPAGAAVLIGLGVIFLLHTAGLFEFGLDRFWPLILIFLGVWLFAKQWGLIGGCVGCQCEHCRTRKLMGPAMLITLGVLFLLDSVSRVGFGRTWPAILLVIGVVKLMQSNASSSGHVGPLPPDTQPYVPPTVPPNVPPPQAPPSPDQTTSSGEVNHV
jgi:cell wall-active antibiotic response 4TMS protein YvqF/B-box zinc finger protein